MAKERNDLNITWITAFATIVAALTAATSSIAVAWISAQNAAPKAVNSELSDQAGKINELQALARESANRLNELKDATQKVDQEFGRVEQLRVGIESLEKRFE